MNVHHELMERMTDKHPSSGEIDNATCKSFLPQQGTRDSKEHSTKLEQIKESSRENDKYEIPHRKQDLVRIAQDKAISHESSDYNDHSRNTKRPHDRKDYIFDTRDCKVSWAALGTAGSIVGCFSTAGSHHAKCTWDRSNREYAAYTCVESIKGTYTTQSEEIKHGCVMSLDPNLGLARFHCSGQA